MTGRCPGFSAKQTRDDLRLNRRWTRHPKTRKLVRRLGYEAPFSLLALWGWAADNRHRGVLTDMDAEDIALASDWDGDPEKWVETLVELAWIDPPSDTDTVSDDRWHRLHDWEEHQPWIFALDERQKWSDEMNSRRKSKNGKRRKPRKNRARTDTVSDTGSDRGPGTVSGVGSSPPLPTPPRRGMGEGVGGEAPPPSDLTPTGPAGGGATEEELPGSMVFCADCIRSDDGFIQAATRSPDDDGQNPPMEPLCGPCYDRWYEDAQRAPKSLEGQEGPSEGSSDDRRSLLREEAP